MSEVTFHRVLIDEVSMFYREAGTPEKPTVLLLHGFPTGSYMFHDLLLQLSPDYHVVAPDLPGFGDTRAPPRGKYSYTFEALSKTLEGFVDALGLDKFALYIFDYGAPVGLRLALARPDSVTAIISQNGNAYEEGLSAAWAPWRAYWAEPTAEHRKACRAFLTDKAIEDQHAHGNESASVSPDGANLDIFNMRQGEREEIQLDLILDYRTNVELYPEFQEYFRRHQPAFMAAWGRHDAFFLPAGAIAFTRDLPHAEVHLVDAGHFALAARGDEIGDLVRRFLASRLRTSGVTPEAEA